jgi:protein disulfide-isomerase A6
VDVCSFLRVSCFIYFADRLTIDCKSLAPTWEALARDFAAEPSIVIAKVDATADNAKATAQDQGVQSYPTIQYFPKGSTTSEEYEGGRSENDFIEFLNAKVGTHRVAGGGLDATAGTVASLDAIISQFSAGGNLAVISKEVAETARGLQDKYSPYYIRVLEKLAKSQGYAEKELARLENLVQKGGLAPEKVDDLVSRSNILRKFMGRKDIKDEL